MPVVAGHLTRRHIFFNGCMLQLYNKWQLKLEAQWSLLEGIADVPEDKADISMVSWEVHNAEIEQVTFWVSVAKYAVVSVVKERNTIPDDIL